MKEQPLNAYYALSEYASSGMTNTSGLVIGQRQRKLGQVLGGGGGVGNNTLTN